MLPIVPGITNNFPALQKALVPLSYPNNIDDIPDFSGGIFTADKDYPGIFNETHNAVMFIGTAYKYDMNDEMTYYPIIPYYYGEYALKFSLWGDASLVEFIENGNVITRYTDVKADEWYDFCTIPVNLYAISRGQCFLRVKYLDFEPQSIKCIYLSCDDKTRRQTIIQGSTAYNR